MSGMKIISSLSNARYKIYEVEEGVMAMKDKSEDKLYYFPSTNDIDPDYIKSHDKFQQDIEFIYNTEEL